MTDVSNLKALAAKINAKTSPNVSKYAIAQAAATVSQEAEIAAIKKEIEMLKGSGSGRREGPPLRVEPLPVPRKGVSIGYANAHTITGTARRAILDHCEAVGAAMVRVDSTTGNQSTLDTVVDEIIERGMEPFIVLHGTVQSITYADALAFATSQGAKWAGNGKCRLFEFCNEPDWQGITPEDYADASHGFVEGLAATHPNAVTMLGALFKFEDDSPNGLQSCAEYVRRMLVQGLPQFDYLTVHIYDEVGWNDPRNSWHQLYINANNNIRDHLDAAGRTSVRIGITEANNPVGHPYTEAQQALFPGDYDTKMRAGHADFMLCYSMTDDSNSPGVADGYGLLRMNGTQRPAYTTFAAVSATV